MEPVSSQYRLKIECGELELNEAVELGSLDRVKQLVDVSGVNVEEPTYQHYIANALFCAAVHGDLDIMRYLVGCRADIHIEDNSDDLTPFMMAAEHGHVELLRYLRSEHNIDVNLKCYSGFTALALAAERGHMDVVCYLAGDCKANVHDDEDSGPFWVAAQNGHANIMQYLRRERDIEHDIDAARVDDALQSAVMNGHLGVVRY